MIVGSSVSMGSLSLFLMTLAPVVFAETAHFRHLQDVPTCDNGENDIVALVFCYGRNTDTCNDSYECITGFDELFQSTPDICAMVVDSCECPECRNEEIAFQQTPGCKGDNICGTDNSCPDTKFCNFDNGIEKGGNCECCVDSCRNAGLKNSAALEDCIKQCGDRTLAPTISYYPTNPPQYYSGPLFDLVNCYRPIGSCKACLGKFIYVSKDSDFTPELCLDVVNACDCPVCLEEERAWLSTEKCMKKNKDSKKDKKDKKGKKEKKVQKTKKETKVKSAKLPKGPK